MAIVTGSMYKGFTFGGINSKDYGVYISGDGVFNAPEKDVEMISIPGRSGSFALDHGRWLNIELAYPAGLFGSDETDFAQAISDLRNALASKKGYQVLEDDYHPGEFRQAIYHSGLEVTPAQLKAGEFTITFDCKPQRWLTAGQDDITVTSGDTITNPTPFDAQPLLQVWGTGTVSLGGQNITITGTNRIGRIVLAPYAVDTNRQTFNTALLNTGDQISVDVCSVDIEYTLSDLTKGSITDVVIGTSTAAWKTTETATINGNGFVLHIESPVTNIVNGTHTDHVMTTILTVSYEDGTSETIDNTATFNYDVPGSYVSFSVSTSIPTSMYRPNWSNRAMGDVIGVSSVLSAGTPAYIDLDIGEAYKEVSGSYVSINNAVSLGAALPTLPPGGTVVTYPNTVAQLIIVPRWWKV